MLVHQAENSLSVSLAAALHQTFRPVNGFAEFLGILLGLLESLQGIVIMGVFIRISDFGCIQLGATEYGVK